MRVVSGLVRCCWEKSTEIKTCWAGSYWLIVMADSQPPHHALRSSSSDWIIIFTFFMAWAFGPRSSSPRRLLRDGHEDEERSVQVSNIRIRNTIGATATNSR